MITEMQVVDRDRAAVSWWKNVERLKRRKVFRFKPGVNILWGPNGSGKTTLIKTLAQMLHAEQGGQTTVTQHSIGELFPGFSYQKTEADRYRNGVIPIHDGQAVMHFDPATVVGLIAHGAGFDDDFGFQGLQNLMQRGSAGQDVLGRMNPIFSVLMGEEKWPDILWKVNREMVNDLWRSRLDLIEETLKGTIPTGQPTVLLDEPDRSFDIVHQYGLWMRLPESAARFQLIIATHSLFAVNIPGAHYIDLEKGYLAKCRKAINWAFKGGDDGRADTSSG